MNKKIKKITDKKNIIKPRTLKGFRDFYGPDAKLREYVIGVFRRVFEKYGYQPLETPTLEYADILLGKAGGEMDQLAYIFKDQGGREIGLRFDMTVPACRFVAQNYNSLVFPFKRYQIQLAWRAENTQKGRFREFTQCDADVWGTKSVLVDAEFIQMGIEAIQTLGFKNFSARINNRKILNGIFQTSGIPKNKEYDLAISLDKLEKIGPIAVKKDAINRQISPTVIQKALEIITISGSSEEKLAKLKKTLPSDAKTQEGLTETQSILDYLKSAGVSSSLYQFDPRIIRGMGYYTGPVWEFVITDENIGSIAGCGRYDELTGLYTGRDIPASGGSFGIERIIEILKDKKIKGFSPLATLILVTVFFPDLLNPAINLAKNLRSSGFNTELYPDPSTPLPKQFKYASQKNIPFVAIIGPDEAKANTISLKDMLTGQQKTLTFPQIVSHLKTPLS